MHYSPASKGNAPYKTKDPAMITPAMTRDSEDDLDDPEKAYAEPARVGKRAKVRRHCARFWWCYAIAVIIFAAIMLPVLFLKIIPAVAQRVVDNTDLPIKSVTFKAVSSDLIQISLTTSLDMPKGLNVGLDPFSLYMYNPGTEGGFYPYLSLDMKALSLSGNTEISVQDQMLPVSNHTEFNSWLNRTFVNNTTEISVRGDTTAHLGALKMGIHLAKTVPLAGLRKLDGMKLEGMKLVLPPEADGTNMVGNFTLPNWSQVLTLDLGDITLDVLAGETVVGNATMRDVVLPPGNTTLPFRGRLSVPTLVDNFGGLLSSQGAALGRGRLTLGLRGGRVEVLGDVVDSVASRNSTASLPGLLGLAGDVLGKGLQGTLDKLMGDLNITVPALPGETSSGGGGDGGEGLLGQGDLGGWLIS
ncbi:hypothetical protein PG999_007437 [Apiospora kogelbergensis]|uniref:Uncharacterized protein n=1 Tax=Apiospora kogelbergensis TaxID=1337665 RepID=A0AAW0QYB8_9PEZI